MTGPRNHCSSLSRPQRGADLVLLPHPGKPTGLLRKEAGGSSPSSSGISLPSHSDLTQHCSLEIALNQTSRPVFLPSQKQILRCTLNCPLMPYLRYAVSFEYLKKCKYANSTNTIKVKPVMKNVVWNCACIINPYLMICYQRGN